jgi:hypothetical protein
MAQQTFSGVPGAFSAGEVLSSADQNLIRDLMIAVIKEGMTGDTGEILPMIMDLTNNRIVLDTGGLEFSDGSLQTIAAAAGMTWSGSTANGIGTYASSSSIVSEATATYDGTTLALTTSGGGIQLDGLNSSNANTLDDYEEGTWTVGATAASGTITIEGSQNTGLYIKIGKLVWVQCHSDTSAISSPSGALNVTGMPFTSAGAPWNHMNGTLTYCDSAFTSGPVTQLPNGSTSVSITDGSGGTANTDAASKVKVGTSFWLAGCYVANA